MDQELLGTVDWHISNVIDAATRWCVPVFVMLSGSLLLDSQRHASPRAFWEKRISRLLPAFLVWQAVYFAWRAWYWHQPMTLRIVAHDVLIGRPYIHLYFLYLITGLYLVTPFLARTLRVLTLPQIRQLVLLFACLSIGANLIDFLGSSAFTIFVPYLAYYLAGWYCARMPVGRPSGYALALALAVGLIVITVSTVLSVAAFGFDDRWSFYFYEDFNPAVMITAVAVFLFTLNTELPPMLQALAKQLAPWTLGVYLAHPIVVELLRYGYYVSAPLLLSPPYYVPVTFLATCILTFGLVALMHQVPGLRRIV
jgi:surface polysaccharide O-acyltransferase-like enzyme